MRKSKAPEEIVLDHFYAIKAYETACEQDFIIGPNADGSYYLNLLNIILAASDAYGRLFRLDMFGNIISCEPLYFEEDLIYTQASTFEKLTKRIDKRIQKRLVWVNDLSGNGLFCVGIR